MAKKGFRSRTVGLVFILALMLSLASGSPATAQEAGPVILDPALGVRPVLSGLTTPIGMAFLSENEMFVIEKNSGQVWYVAGEEDPVSVLDLAVNFGSERGLLGITLDPDFNNNPYVYLYWTCSAPPPTGSPFYPSEVECADNPNNGEDTDDLLAVPLLGNRVDRFVWDGSALTWDANLVKLRAFQNDGAPLPRGQGDEEQPARGNHNGGVITFGPDGMLYILIGDVGRRGVMQNLPYGPTAELNPILPATDDQFGGPFPDDAHYTGVILRLNPDGSIPGDNPFYDIGAQVGGEIGENIQKTFAYGIRNSFGMDFDPQSGSLWLEENGEDAYDELNLVGPGFNSGWIQLIGPQADIADYKEIESTSLHFDDFPNLQQFRWGPENIAATPEEALSRMFAIPNSYYADPVFSWEFVITLAALGFHEGDALGEAYQDDLFMGLAVPIPLDGPLFRLELTEDRTAIAGVESAEAENETFNSLIGSEPFLIGTGFGVVTDIETGPNGSLYVVSLSNGAIYEIFNQTQTENVTLQAQLSGAAEVPDPGDPDASGESRVMVNQDAKTVCFSIFTTALTLPATGAHIHVGEEGVPGDVVVPLVPPDESGVSAGCVADVDPDLLQAIVDDPAGYYVNVHTSDFPAGAIRGQLTPE